MEVFFCLVKVSKTLLWLMLAVSLILNSLTIVVAFKITSYLAAGFHVSRAAMFWLSSFNPVFCVYADWPIVSHIVSFRNYESITCYLHNIKIDREKVLFKLKSNNHSWYNKRREWKLWNFLVTSSRFVVREISQSLLLMIFIHFRAIRIPDPYQTRVKTQ